MQVSPMFQTMQDFAVLGYRVTNAYADGVVLMVRSNRKVPIEHRAFVMADGSFTIRNRRTLDRWGTGNNMAIAD